MYRSEDRAALDRAGDPCSGAGLDSDFSSPGDTGPEAAPTRDTVAVVLAQEPAIGLGALSIDPKRRRIAHADGREAFLEPRVMQVLVALIRADGDVVSRDQLFAACWPGVVVGDDALNRVVGRLRRLEQGLAAGAFEIETINKVGYRLILPGATPPATARDAADEGLRPSICVLPFVNMSADPQQEYFSDGISEDIITDLSKISALFVVARTTAFAFRGSTLEVPALARKLNVSHVLEGSVRRVGARVRINAQLIDGATGGHVWAERFDRDLHDIFALQDEISEAIVAALKLKLLPEERQAIEHRRTAHPEAYDLYLMARRYVDAQRGEALGLEAAERLCRRATEIDPGYALAWSLLAVAQADLRFTYARPGDGGLEALERALCIDPDLAEARAVKARLLVYEGRHEEASAEIAAALRLEPDSWLVNSVAARLRYVQHRFEEAIGHWEKAIALKQTCPGDAGMLMSSYHAIGDMEGVLRTARLTLSAAEDALAQDHVNGTALGCAVGALAALGETERARSMMERGLLIDPENMTMRYNFACGMSSFLGDVGGSLALLETVFERGPTSLIDHALIDPDLAPARSDPRFTALIAAAEARKGRAQTR